MGPSKRHKAAEAGPDLSEAFDLVLDRRFSCRAFRPDIVPEQIIREILESAQKTASWCNTQPWHVYLLTDSEAFERFRTGLLHACDNDAPSWDVAPPAEYHGVFLERRREAGWKLYDAVGVAKGDRAASARQARENFRLFGAPHLAIVAYDRTHGSYGMADCGAYVANFLSAASARGVSTIAQAALVSRAAFIRRALKIADEEALFCGISFGWPDREHPANGFRTERAGLDAAVTFVGAGDLADPELDRKP